MLDYAYPRLTRLDRLMRDDRGLPFKCWCPNDRENVVRLRPKYEIGQLCKVCMGDLG